MSRGGEPGSGGPAERAHDRLAEAVALMARIRRDGRWESAQTHSSLLPYLIEESWEFVDAVADGDRDDLRSELGDLLLQVLFHAAIAAEHTDEPFDIQDVAGALLDKLRRRAPYWFDENTNNADSDDNNNADSDDDNDDDANKSDDDAVAAFAPADEGPSSTGAPDAAEQDRLWQEAKAAERAGRPPRGVVEGLAWGMPALALGQKVLDRARAAGIPDDLVPAGMRLVPVEPSGGLFTRSAPAADREPADEGVAAAHTEPVAGGGVVVESGSAEIAYRGVVRRFADTIHAAEAALPVPARQATAADWRAAWPSWASGQRG